MGEPVRHYRPAEPELRTGQRRLRPSRKSGGRRVAASGALLYPLPGARLMALSSLRKPAAAYLWKPDGAAAVSRPPRRPAPGVRVGDAGARRQMLPEVCIGKWEAGGLKSPGSIPPAAPCGVEAAGACWRSGERGRVWL